MNEKNQNTEELNSQKELVSAETEEEISKESQTDHHTYEPEEQDVTRMMDIPHKHSEDVSKDSGCATRMMDIPQKEYSNFDMEILDSDFHPERIESALTRKASETREQPENPKKEQKSQPQRSKKKKKKKNRILGIIVRAVITISILGFCALLSMTVINAAGDIFGLKESDQETKVEINQGATITEIAQILKDEGIIDYPLVFRLYIKYMAEDVNFKPGLFTLHPSMPYDDLITEMEKDTESNVVAEVTIKEGANIYEIAQLLYEEGVCSVSDFMEAVNTHTFEYDFLTNIGDTSQRYYKLEGYLFPDTYLFYRNSDPDTVIKKMLDNFDARYTEEMRAATANMGLSIDDIVRLASIVQAEAPDFEEMKKVSSVYWNRLNNEEEFPKMQSDPTAKYAKRVLQANGAPQEIVDAYNTYNTQGLPVGPINNPGADALKATLYPANTTYYFFCTNLDTKQFFYATTYEEHKKNLADAGLNENEVLE